MTAVVGCQSQPSLTVSAAPSHNTELARAENERALALIETGKYTGAEPLLNHAIEVDGTFGPAHNNLGLVYYHTSRLYPAAWEFENAIKLLPRQPEPRNNLGLVLEQAGKLEEAIRTYEKAQGMQPTNAEFVGNLARAKIQRGDRDAETRRLLTDIVEKDSRPEWRHWARLSLFRLQHAERSSAPAAPPAAP